MILTSPETQTHTNTCIHSQTDTPPPLPAALQLTPNLLPACTQNTASFFLSLLVVSNHCDFIAKPHSAGFYRPLRRWGWEREKKRRNGGKKQTATDLNVALIKMACTRGEEYEPRNVLFLFSSFLFSSHVIQIFFCCSHSSLFFLASIFSSCSHLFLSSCLHFDSPPPQTHSSVHFSIFFLQRTSIYV